jgi:hypothetical protein
MLPWWIWIFLIAIFSMQIYQLVACGCGDAAAAAAAGTAGIDIQTLKTSAQTNIITIMVVATIFLSIAAYYFLSYNPQQERAYVMLMLHASIFVSVISASMAAMQQLNAV